MVGGYYNGGSSMWLPLADRQVEDPLLALAMYVPLPLVSCTKLSVLCSIDQLTLPNSRQGNSLEVLVLVEIRQNGNGFPRCRRSSYLRQHCQHHNHQCHHQDHDCYTSRKGSGCLPWVMLETTSPLLEGVIMATRP